MALSTTEIPSVIVTGGASGIGLAIVKSFASQGLHITIFDISEAAAISGLSSLRQEFPAAKFAFQKCDVSKWEDQKAAFERTFQEFGHIDTVIANAGISESKPDFLSKDEGEPEKPTFTTLDVNLTGMLYTVKLAVHYLRKNQRLQKGSIICTASNAGLYPFPIAPIYAASKHAIVGAVRSLGKPLEAEGIQINGLAPSVIATNLADSNLFSSMILTPVSTAVKAVRNFVSKPELSGIIAEISGDNYTFRSPPEYVDSMTKSNLEVFEKLGYA